MSGYQKKTKYYSDVVYEFNLPVGHTCPFAETCLVKVDRNTGKFVNKSIDYKCYAASAERFPGVRDSRWTNFSDAKDGVVPAPPKVAKRIRIHGSGDFFSQAYFDRWLEICTEHPEKEFWAYTKSLLYWNRRINDVPSNLVLTASMGGKHDHLIKHLNLKHVVVVKSFNDTNLPIDTNDDLARDPNIKRFALVDNFASAA